MSSSGSFRPHRWHPDDPPPSHRRYHSRPRPRSPSPKRRRLAPPADELDARLTTHHRPERAATIRYALERRYPREHANLHTNLPKTLPVTLPRVLHLRLARLPPSVFAALPSTTLHALAAADPADPLHPRARAAVNALLNSIIDAAAPPSPQQAADALAAHLDRRHSSPATSPITPSTPPSPPPGKPPVTPARAPATPPHERRKRLDRMRGEVFARLDRLLPKIMAGKADDPSIIAIHRVDAEVELAHHKREENTYASWRGKVVFGAASKETNSVAVVGLWEDYETVEADGELAAARKAIVLPPSGPNEPIRMKYKVQCEKLQEKLKLSAEDRRHVLVIKPAVEEKPELKTLFRKQVAKLKDDNKAGVAMYDDKGDSVQLIMVPPGSYASNALGVSAKSLASGSASADRLFGVFTRKALAQPSPSPQANANGGRAD